MEVFIEKKEWDKIINYARCASDKWSTEIGGMAVTIQDKDGDWQITDPVIMKQEVSAALCELDKTELAAYYSKMAMKYKKKNIRFCWWHSHAKMDAFWRGTDTNTIDEYEDGDLSFALVVNVKEEYKCRVSVWKPFVMHKDVELNILNDEKEFKIPKKINDEVEKFCTQPANNWYNSGSNWNKWTNKGMTSGTIIPKTDQTTLFNGELAKSSENNIVKQAWLQLLEKVDEINTSFIAGEFQYERYANKIKDLNRKLKRAKMPLIVELVEQCDFDQLLHLHAWDLITCEDGWEHLDPYMDYADEQSWNESYLTGGIHGQK